MQKWTLYKVYNGNEHKTCLSHRILFVCIELSLLLFQLFLALVVLGLAVATPQRKLFKRDGKHHHTQSQ